MSRLFLTFASFFRKKMSTQKAKKATGIVRKSQRNRITDDQAEKARYVHLWADSKDSLMFYEKLVNDYEGKLTFLNKMIEHVPLFQLYSNEVVSGDIESPPYWKAKWHACRDRVRIAEKRAKLLQNAYIEVCKEMKQLNLDRFITQTRIE